MTPESATPLPWGERTYIMGILNATPDSFSGDGLLSREDSVTLALRQAEDFLTHGADILDVGGESTRPGADTVGEAQELERVLPIIQALREAFPQVVISVDTYKAEVARRSLALGADWVNDIWGFRADPALAAVVAAHHAPVVLMHNRLKSGSAEVQARLGGHVVGVEYDDLIADICDELLFSVELAHEAGIPDEQIILDPGIGFGKTVNQNLNCWTGWMRSRRWAIPCWLAPRANPSSATRSTSRQMSAWRGPPRRWLSALTGARISSGCMTWP